MPIMGNKRNSLPIDTQVGNAKGTVTICYLDWFHLFILFVCKMYILFLLLEAFHCPMQLVLLQAEKLSAWGKGGEEKKIEYKKYMRLQFTAKKTSEILI